MLVLISRNLEDNPRELHLYTLIQLLILCLLWEKEDNGLQNLIKNPLGLTLPIWVHEHMEEEVRVVADREEELSARSV